MTNEERARLEKATNEMWAKAEAHFANRKPRFGHRPKPKKIAQSTWEVGTGILVMHLWTERDGRPVRDGWKVVIDGEFDMDFGRKSEAIDHAHKWAAERAIAARQNAMKPTNCEDGINGR